MKKFITATMVRDAHASGATEIVAPCATTGITPEALTVAAHLGIRFVEGESMPAVAAGASPSSDAEKLKAITRTIVESLPQDKRRPDIIRPLVEEALNAGEKRVDPEPALPPCKREVDASGLVVVRGKSVSLALFPGAGEGKNVGLADVITGADRSPMTAGIMSWRRQDSFAWKLDYDEIDLVLDGILKITIDGRSYEAAPGDIVYIPKGSSIVFGTPGFVRIFYVTYPADWAAM